MEVELAALAALEQRRAEEVAALEAENKAMRTRQMQAAQLASQLAAARAGEAQRHVLGDAGEGEKSEQHEDAMMAEICSLLVETGDRIQALGPGVSDSLSAALANGMDSAASAFAGRILEEALHDTVLEDTVQNISAIIGSR